MRQPTPSVKSQKQMRPHSLPSPLLLMSCSKPSAKYWKRRKAMRKKKALVIDDEQIVLDSVKRILSEADYEVEMTLSGGRGLEWGIQKNYDVVLPDIGGPDMGG